MPAHVIEVGAVVRRLQGESTRVQQTHAQRLSSGRQTAVLIVIWVGHRAESELVLLEVRGESWLLLLVHVVVELALLLVGGRGRHDLGHRWVIHVAFEHLRRSWGLISGELWLLMGSVMGGDCGLRPTATLSSLLLLMVSRPQLRLWSEVR